MTLFETLDSDIKIAMKEKKKEELMVLRTLKSALKDVIINEKLEMTDDIFTSVITKAIKQRKDSIESFKLAKRDELIEKDQFGIDVLTRYMPVQLSKEEVENIVERILKENNIESKQEMGNAMKYLMAELKGKADGKLINQAAMKFLN